MRQKNMYLTPDFITFSKFTGENVKPIHQWTLFLFCAIGSLQKKIQHKKIRVIIPKSIHGYALVKRLPSSFLQPEICVAQYKNSKNEKIVVKFWNGYTKDYYYYSFINEIRSYMLLNSILKRVQNKTPREFKNVSIPKIIFLDRVNKSIVFAREYKAGKIAFSLSAKNKLKVYFQVINFLSFLSKEMSKQEKEMFVKRGIFSYLVFYPLFWIKAAIANPKALPLLIKSITPLYVSMISSRSNFQETLVHRDLHFKNILVSNESIILLDLQYFAITDELHEFATTLRYRWQVDEFYKLFIVKLIKKYRARKNFNNLLKGFIVNTVTIGLTNKKFPKEKVNRWIHLLGWIHNGKLEGVI